MTLALLALLGRPVAAAEEPSVGAVRQLPPMPGLFERWDHQRSWGTPLLVRTLTEAAERLAWERPDLPPLTIGDISNRGGGPMFGHTSHDLGIDADIGLFLRHGRQHNGFWDVHPSDLDVEATWAMIQALLDTGNVQFILLDQGHIERLRAYLVGRLDWSPAEADEVLLAPGTRLSPKLRGVLRHAPNHAGHVHVRITPDDSSESAWVEP